MTDDKRPYLHALPAGPIRRLLEVAARDEAHLAVHVFDEEEAAADIMLALDRGETKPIRYYAERWKWPKSRVHEKLPSIKETANQWRTWFGRMSQQIPDSAGQHPDKAGQKTRRTPSKSPVSGQVPDKAGQPSDSIEQNFKTTLSPPDAGDENAVSIYESRFGRRLTAYQEEQLGRKATDLECWKQVCDDWRLDNYSPRILHGLLQKYERLVESRRLEADRNSRRDVEEAHRPHTSPNGSRVRPRKNGFTRPGEQTTVAHIRASGYSDADIDRLAKARQLSKAQSTRGTSDGGRDRGSHRGTRRLDGPHGGTGSSGTDGTDDGES